MANKNKLLASTLEKMFEAVDSGKLDRVIKISSELDRKAEIPGVKDIFGPYDDCRKYLLQAANSTDKVARKSALKQARDAYSIL